MADDPDQLKRAAEARQRHRRAAPATSGDDVYTPPPPDEERPQVPTHYRLPDIRERIRLRNQQLVAQLLQQSQLARQQDNENVVSTVRGPRLSFLPLAERLRIYTEQLVEEQRRVFRVPHAVDAFANPNQATRRRGGEEVYQRLVKCFGSFPEPPTPFQWKLFSATCSACAPIIVGTAFFNDPTRWIKMIGGRFTDGIVGILTGRKTGKSTGLAYIIICLMFHISALQCIISSKTLEQARIILVTVQTLITRHPEFASGNYTIIESRATALVIRGPDGVRIGWVRC